MVPQHPLAYRLLGIDYSSRVAHLQGLDNH